MDSWLDGRNSYVNFLAHILGQRVPSMNNSIWQQQDSILQLWDDENWQDGFSIFFFMFNKRVFQFSVQKLWPAAAACNQHKRIPRPTDFLYKSSGGELAMHISKKHRPKKEGRLGLKWSRIITSPQQKSDYKNATFFLYFLSYSRVPMFLET